MPKLAMSTVVTHPETGAPVVLREGEDLPDWAEPLVGDHVIDKPTSAPAGRRKSG